MIKELIHDPIFLGGKSETATKADLQVATDLLDTLTAHKDECVGMAANMIGIPKQIIAFDNEGSYMIMLNPEILEKYGQYETEESCLSLLGSPRKCLRYNAIKVKWQTLDFETKEDTFFGWTAQIIQHEVDYCNGILIQHY